MATSSKLRELGSWPVAGARAAPWAEFPGPRA